MPIGKESRNEEWILSRSWVSDNGCWLWILGLSGNNKYGSATALSGKMVPAHRLSWEIFKGQIPIGMEVCHKCDIPPCVNPDHLFLGTHLDNMRDMVLKGRKNPQRGEHQGGSKLKESDVLKIREKYISTDATFSDLSREFNISITNIMDVINGKSWTHLPVSSKAELRRKWEMVRRLRFGLTPDQVVALISAYKTGTFNFRTVREEYGISTSHAYNIIKGRRVYAHG
jgi:hypothetical protein